MHTYHTVLEIRLPDVCVRWKDTEYHYWGLMRERNLKEPDPGTIWEGCSHYGLEWSSSPISLSHCFPRRKNPAEFLSQSFSSSDPQMDTEQWLSYCNHLISSLGGHEKAGKKGGRKAVVIPALCPLPSKLLSPGVSVLCTEPKSSGCLRWKPLHK